MMRCKVGDLCWIVGGKFPVNIGRIVKVLRRSKLYECGWLVQSQGSPLTGREGKSMEGAIYDSSLLPIRPEPESQPAPPVREELTI